MAPHQGPRDVRDDVDDDRQHDQAGGHPDDRQPEQRAGPQPAVGRCAGRLEQRGSGRRAPVAVPVARTRSVRPIQNSRRRRPAEPRPSAMATSGAGSTEHRPDGDRRGSACRPRGRGRRRAVPRTTGAPTANRISSSVQAIGWTTATTTASRVSAIMISRKVRLPKPGVGRAGRRRDADGHVAEDAGQSRSSPRIASTRPRALRTRMSSSRRADGVGGHPLARERRARASRR